MKSIFGRIGRLLNHPLTPDLLALLYAVTILTVHLWNAPRIFDVAFADETSYISNGLVPPASSIFRSRGCAFCCISSRLLMAHRVTYCAATECRLSGYCRHCTKRAQSRSVANDPKPTSAAAYCCNAQCSSRWKPSDRRWIERDVEKCAHYPIAEMSPIAEGLGQGYRAAHVADWPADK
jgi:hypothetical protein